MKLFRLGYLLFSFILQPQFGQCENRENNLSLDGHWISTCQQGKISEMIVDKSSSFLREAFYQESECHTLLFFIETTGLLNYPITETTMAFEFIQENQKPFNSCNSILSSKNIITAQVKAKSLPSIGLLNQIQFSDVKTIHSIDELQKFSNIIPTITLNLSQYSLVDYTYQEVAIRPISSEIATQFNKTQMCDINSWKTLVPTPITGKHCRFVAGARPIQIPYYQQNRFGIFKILEPFLYFGQNNLLEDSSSPSRRPKDINPEPFGKRY